MRKKLALVIIVTLSIFGLMFAEYRYIMWNLRPYRGERGTVYVEMFGQIEEYYADPIEEYYK